MSPKTFLAIYLCFIFFRFIFIPMKNFSTYIKDFLKLFSRKKSFSGNLSFGSSSGSTGAKYKSYAYACINARAENIAKAKVYLYNAETKTEIPKHPFLDLIVKPNKQNQTFKEILHKISSSLDLYGNSYVFIQRGVRKAPIGLYFLPSNMVNPVYNGQQTEIINYEYIVNGQKSIYKTEDIIHFTIPDPDNNLLGKSTISAFNFSLDIDYYQNLYQRNYYLNDAALGLIIETENQMDDNDVERLKSEIQNQYEGSGNVGRTLLLQGGLKAFDIYRKYDIVSNEEIREIEGFSKLKQSKCLKN